MLGIRASTRNLGDTNIQPTALFKTQRKRRRREECYHLIHTAQNPPFQSVQFSVSQILASRSISTLADPSTSIAPVRNPKSISSHSLVPLLSAPGNHKSHLSLKLCSSQTVHLNGVLLHMASFTYTVSTGLVQAVTCVRMSFLSMDKGYSITRQTTIFSVWHSSCFHFQAIINNLAMNISVCIFMCVQLLFSFLWDNTLKGRSAGVVG